MTPARSLAASVVALGFAGALTAPQPALAAPAPCERAENFAAQSGAELLRINKLEVRTSAAERPRVKAEEGESEDAADAVTPDPEDSDTLSEGIGKIGAGALGYLGAAPKQTAETDGDAEVVGKIAERLTDTSGAGGGEAIKTDPSRTDGASLTEVGLGEARTAMIAPARVSSAAYARILDGRSGNKSIAKPLLQQAPPTNAEAAQRSTPATKAGPLRLGDGKIRTHARWSAGMACGQVTGETGRADTSLSSVNLLNSGTKALVQVPGTMTSRGTTAIENSGSDARTVARSTVTAGRIELAGGRVRLRVLRAPTLEAAMSATSGGKISYRSAIVEVSGDGIATKRLEAAGEHVDVSLTPDRRTMESAQLADLGDLREAAPMPVPTVPGLPSVTAPEPESATAPAQGTRLRVALGDVRHAVKGHAIAARASAIKVALLQNSGSDGYGGGRSEVSLAMSLGVLEAAAVSPDSPELSSAGAGGGLPVTGPRLDRIAIVGGALLLAGIGAVLLGRRRRRPTV
ncbi:LPXTG cell wall anchor domain-containing protein [Actinoplanes bogorensis]|uniref:LPXTG cell wall anchor domain-containing protein n=1 Tax=Paractinoplanes bogorensis TaxID=1610840 RepID=A0ABS5YW50_9ACTN|nr:LPXTG cell wall anchor domain-containing protein [Actinoplanes bogorensis]MBU2667655.1 LPXTG cell wall anchor domain-containing protein [Actinoplanes bogorensis]